MGCPLHGPRDPYVHMYNRSVPGNSGRKVIRTTVRLAQRHLAWWALHVLHSWFCRILRGERTKEKPDAHEVWWPWRFAVAQFVTTQSACQSVSTVSITVEPGWEPSYRRLKKIVEINVRVPGSRCDANIFTL